MKMNQEEFNMKRKIGNVRSQLLVVALAVTIALVIPTKYVLAAQVGSSAPPPSFADLVDKVYRSK